MSLSSYKFFYSSLDILQTICKIIKIVQFTVLFISIFNILLYHSRFFYLLLYLISPSPFICFLILSFSCKGWLLQFNVSSTDIVNSLQLVRILKNPSESFPNNQKKNFPHGIDFYWCSPECDRGNDEESSKTVGYHSDVEEKLGTLFQFYCNI